MRPFGRVLLAGAVGRCGGVGPERSLGLGHRSQRHDAGRPGVRWEQLDRDVPDVGGGNGEPLFSQSGRLPPATAPPAPAPPTLADQPPLQPHEVFAFAPYWTLPQSGSFNVGGMTTLAYFSIGVNPDGSLDETGSGWNGYESQELANLVTRAHAAGDRVVLTVNCFDQGALNQLTSSATAPATLSTALVAAVNAKNLDGVNIDFEGQGSGDQNGLTNLISKVSMAMHAANPHWQVTMDTYASSAGDPQGFYNIAALAPWVDGFFVMAYQLNYSSTAVPVSPLTSSMFSDLTTVQQYAAAVPASKVILGLPFLRSSLADHQQERSTAPSTGPSSPITPTSQIVSSGHPIYWDSHYRTPLGRRTRWGSQWHETFFEDPTSLYMDALLAQNYGLWTGWGSGRSGWTAVTRRCSRRSTACPRRRNPVRQVPPPPPPPQPRHPRAPPPPPPPRHRNRGPPPLRRQCRSPHATTTTPTTYADTGQYLSQTVTLTQLTSAGEPSRQLEPDRPALGLHHHRSVARMSHH